MARSQNLVLFWVLLLLLNPIAFSQPDGELFFPGFKNSDGNITLDGDAAVERNGLLRLTNVTRRVLGHAFYQSPVRFKNATDGKALSFSTAFAFAILPEYPTLGGHGLAFTLSPNRGFPGALPAQQLGLLNATTMGNSTNHIFAVELDTVQDLEYGDINDNHIGVDINSLKSSSSVPATYFTQYSTKEEINLKSGKVIQAWIDYDSGKKQLNVMLSPSSTKPRSPILSYDVDLSPILKEFMCIGFSSSTGLLASRHYLLGWSFNMSGEARSLSLGSLPKLPRQEKNRTALIVGVSVAVVVVLFLVLGVCLYLKRKKKKADMK